MTPEATLAVCDRMAPGIADAIRMHSLSITDRAMFGRGSIGDPQKDIDRESAGKSESGKRKS